MLECRPNAGLEMRVDARDGLRACQRVATCRSGSHADLRAPALSSMPSPHWSCSSAPAFAPPPPRCLPWWEPARADRSTRSTCRRSGTAIWSCTHTASSTPILRWRCRRRRTDRICSAHESQAWDTRLRIRASPTTAIRSRAQSSAPTSSAAHSRRRLDSRAALTWLATRWEVLRCSPWRKPIRGSTPAHCRCVRRSAGGRQRFSILGNGRVLFDYFFPGAVPGGPFTVPQGTSFAPGSPAFNGALGALVGGLSAPGQPTLQFAIAAKLPFRSVPELINSGMSVVGFSVRFTNDVLDRTSGQVPYENRVTLSADRQTTRRSMPASSALPVRQMR